SAHACTRHRPASTHVRTSPVHSDWLMGVKGRSRRRSAAHGWALGSCGVAFVLRFNLIGTQRPRELRLLSGLAAAVQPLLDVTNPPANPTFRKLCLGRQIAPVAQSIKCSL